MDSAYVMAIISLVLAAIAFLTQLPETIERASALTSRLRRWSIESKISKLEEELSFINRLCDEPSFLIANLGKNIIILLGLITFSVFWNFKIESGLNIYEVSFVVSMAFAWGIGHIVGVAYRYCRYVLKREQYISDIQSRVLLQRQKLS
ncbi:hypothetical protein [Grimontia hollisae]|uniref:DUF2721 domain-containing protein n=1 Tax=Grimontia hollisae TaxID=673 RepID=A0A377HPH8_GRIHO|nr:hypothetical protein [Grimontia hollisae]STO57592.1 Uncharacterised protein [Grimontia hollisae]